MCLYTRSTFWCGCTIDGPEPEKECNNRGHCTPEFIPEEIADICAYCAVSVNVPASDISMNNWNAGCSDTTVQGINNDKNQTGYHPNGHAAYQENPLTINPSVLHPHPSPPSSITGVPNITQTVQHVLVEPLFNTTDFSQSGPVNPPQQLIPPFQDANGATFYEGPHIFIASDYGCHSVDAHLPSVGETPFNPTDAELERLEQTILDDTFSFFPQIPGFDTGMDLENSVVTTGNQATTGSNGLAVSAAENGQSSFGIRRLSDIQADVIGTKAAREVQALLSPKRLKNKNQQESSEIPPFPSVEDALHENRPAETTTPAPDPDQDIQTPVTYPLTPSADLESTRDEQEDTVRSRSKYSADESMADAPDASNIDESQHQAQQQYAPQHVAQPTPAPEQQKQKQQKQVTETEIEGHEAGQQPKGTKRRASGATGRRKRKGPRLTIRKYAWQRSGARRSSTQEPKSEDENAE